MKWFHVAGLLSFAGVAFAQEPAAPPASAGAAPAPVAAAYGLQELRTLPFDGVTLPKITLYPFGSSLGRMFFPRDGKRLFVGMQSGPRGATYAIDLATGVVANPPTPGYCFGALAHGPLLFTDRAFEAPEDPDWKPVPVPERSDVFASPSGEVAVITAVTGGLFGGIATNRLDLVTGKRLRLNLGDCSATGVAFAADGSVAVARGQAAAGGRMAIESIRVFDATGKQRLDAKVTGSDARVLGFTHDSTGVVFADDQLRIVDLASGSLRVAAPVRPVRWLPLGTTAALSHDAERVVVHDAATLAVVKEFPLGLPDPEAAAGEPLPPRLLQCAVSPDGTLLAVAGPTQWKLFRIVGASR